MNNDKPFIEAILADPQDEAPWLIYADWLEERGDPRGEFLRLETALASLPKEDVRARQFQDRLRVLQPTIDAEWLALLDRSRIEGCWRQEMGAVRGRVELEFQCPLSWDKLKRTDDNLVRFCEQCHKRVFFAADLHEARRHAEFGHCIAVDSHLVRKKGDVRINSLRDPEMVVLGMPPPPAPRYAVGDQVRIRKGRHKGEIGSIVTLRLARLLATVEMGHADHDRVEFAFEEFEPVIPPRRGRRR
jgi:uncharacterized protein (TIGR02996 family)